MQEPAFDVDYLVALGRVTSVHLAAVSGLAGSPQANSHGGWKFDHRTPSAGLCRVMCQSMAQTYNRCEPSGTKARILPEK